MLGGRDFLLFFLSWGGGDGRDGLSLGCYQRARLAATKDREFCLDKDLCFTGLAISELSNSV